MGTRHARALIGAIVVAWAAAPAAAQSDRCADPAVPAVSVTFVGDAWTDAFRSRVLGELAGALAAQDMVACTEAQAAGREVVAQIELRTLGLPRVAVVIEVSDRVTDKRLARDIDLASFPEDGRALALAVASDELMRASFLELAMADAPAPVRPPPPAVTRIVAREVERAAPSMTILGVLAAIEAYGGGETQLGGDLFLSHGLGTQVALSISVGARRGLTRQGQHGTVTSSTLGGSLELRWLPGEGDLRPGLALGVRAAQIFFEAEAAEGGVSRNDGGLVVTPTMAGTLDVRLGAGFVLHLALGAGFPVRAVAALDDGERVTAASGPVLLGRVGIGGTL